MRGQMKLFTLKMGKKHLPPPAEMTKQKSREAGLDILNRSNPKK